MSESNLDRVRGAALDRIERAERHFKAILLAAAALEGAFLLGFLALADLSNRLHLLLLLAAVGVYSLVVVGLFVLGAHVSWCTERALKAVEVTRLPAGPRGPAQEGGPSSG